MLRQETRPGRRPPTSKPATGTPASSASIAGNNRVVCNIAGNKYRLVVEFHYKTGTGFVRFIGTHKEYDRIDVEVV